jgi:hypothetical protein
MSVAAVGDGEMTEALCDISPGGFDGWLGGNAERIPRVVIGPQYGGTWQLLSYITVAFQSAAWGNQ